MLLLLNQGHHQMKKKKSQVFINGMMTRVSIEHVFLFIYIYTGNQI